MNDSPHFSPVDAMIAPDFLMCALHGAHPAGDLRSSKSVPDRFVRQRVPATESIAVVDAPHPWGAPCGHPSDVQICSRQICMVEGQIVRTDNLHGDSRPQGCAQGWAQ